ncbi:uncharacterized protein B0H64DRAFT_100622 [Chaetomium fimeti]|uniref:Uncharacterized protein n=1 Tax=Chaetomium fimeti TaxID=1854472 RepID=A0AAE0HNK1_9PEZI|nr:hypothetical protein B0H64DRAFT_100622 [Chaetomium fimeti]
MHLVVSRQPPGSGTMPRLLPTSRAEHRRMHSPSKRGWPTNLRNRSAPGLACAKLITGESHRAEQSGVVLLCVYQWGIRGGSASGTQRRAHSECFVWTSIPRSCGGGQTLGGFGHSTQLHTRTPVSPTLPRGPEPLFNRCFNRVILTSRPLVFQQVQLQPAGNRARNGRWQPNMDRTTVATGNADGVRPSKRAGREANQQSHANNDTITSTHEASAHIQNACPVYTT